MKTSETFLFLKSHTKDGNERRVGGKRYLFSRILCSTTAQRALRRKSVMMIRLLLLLSPPHYLGIIITTALVLVQLINNLAGVWIGFFVKNVKVMKKTRNFAWLFCSRGILYSSPNMQNYGTVFKMLLNV